LSDEKMSEANESFDREIVRYLKLSCQMPQVLREIKVRQLIQHTAQAKNIVVEPTDIQEASDVLRRQYNLLDSQTTRQWLQCQQLTLSDFEEMLHYNVLYHKLLWVLVGDSIEPYFYEHQLDYLGAIIYEIVLDNFNLAMELFYSIQEREISFWDAAHLHITELELRRRGGYKGLVRRKDMKPQISAAVFAANPPQVLKPIPINKQTHLIFVEEIVRPQLDETLETEIADELFEQWLDLELQKF
jgi:parvulin-like peptidyl-prolyl isomerase